MAKILTKKVKVRVRASHTFTFCHNLAEKVEVWQALTWTFTFLVGTFAIFGELSHFSLLGGTSSILRTFLGGTNQKKHPVQWNTQNNEYYFDVDKMRGSNGKFLLTQHSAVMRKSCSWLMFSFALIYFLTQVKCTFLRTWIVRAWCQRAGYHAPGWGVLLFEKLWICVKPNSKPGWGGQVVGCESSSPPCSRRRSRRGLSGRGTSWSLSGSWTTLTRSQHGLLLLLAA